MHANRLNAFVAGDAGAIGEVLLGPLGEPALDDANVFRQRAAALVDALAPVLVWMRDHKGVLLNIDTVRLSFELRSIWKVATKRVFEVRKLITDETTDIPVPEMPEDLISPLKTYLKRTAGLRHEAGWDRQKTGAPARQHAFAQVYLTHTFPQLGPGTLASG